MESDSAAAPAPAEQTSGVPRRAMLQGLVTAGVAAGTVPLAASSAAAKPTDASVDWQAFDRVVGSAFDRMRLVGAAVAVASANRVLHTVTFGSRCLQPGAR